MFEPPLYLITDRRRFPPPPSGEVFAPEEWRVLEEAIAAGVGAVQLREKDLNGGPLLRRAQALREATRHGSVELLVNDRADVAWAVRADGVHLPEQGLDPADARLVVGPDARIGRSVHGRDALAAVADADFVLFGPVFETASKRIYGPPQGLERLAEICAASAVPVLAVGGITVERVAQVVAHGAAGVAVVSTVLDASDPGARVRELRDALAQVGAR